MRKILFYLCLLQGISCEESFEYDHALVLTGDIVKVEDSVAVFSAKVAHRGKYPIIESGFIWSLYSNDNDGIFITNSDPSLDIYSLKTNYTLLPDKKYYVRAYVKTEHTTTYGRELSFQSGAGNGVEDTMMGDWSTLFNSHEVGSSFLRVQSSFNLNGITYLLFGDGSIYGFNHATNDFNLVLANDIVKTASLSIVYRGNIYIFSKNRFYAFNPEALTFNKLAKWPNDNNTGSTGFLIDDNIYVGLGQYRGYTKDFWRYNISKDIWQKMADFPGDYRVNAFSFNAQGSGYIGGGYNLTKFPYPKMIDLWRYDVAGDLWRKKESLPITYKKGLYLEGVSYQNSGYCFYKGELYEYDSIFNLWKKKTNLDISRYKRNYYFNGFYSPHMFSYGDQIFIVEASQVESEKRFKVWNYAR